MHVIGLAARIILLRLHFKCNAVLELCRLGIVDNLYCLTACMIRNLDNCSFSIALLS